jgi:nephrocystin-3
VALAVTNRTARIFLSSTFRDFGEERDLLVRKVFPALRAKLKDRFVELVDVDLRWGITVEQAERGEVLPICLAEIDRARPYFVGMLGERYGWIPPANGYAADLLEREPWLQPHQGGKSVTELEILHGVLNDPAMAVRAFFYFRAAEYASGKGGDYLAASPEDAARQADLKARIRQTGCPVLEDYADPVAFADRLEVDLWRALDDAFPANEVPDAFERESLRHDAYAAPRRRLYLGGERYLTALDAALTSGAQRILIEGASGGGKSALLANWLETHQHTHPRDVLHVHYTGASADAADPYALARRLCEPIRRTTGSSEALAEDPQKLLDELPKWLAYASAYAEKENTRWIIALDALNGITDLKDLRWWPEFLPARVHCLISCLPGAIREALVTKGDWYNIEVKPLDEPERQALLVSYLARYNKTLPPDLLSRAVAHPLAAKPLFLRTLAEELRLFGIHEQLTERLDQCLSSTTVDDLFERVLERVEVDCSIDALQRSMTAIWASRAGLTEEEIVKIAGLVPATWAPIRYALDNALLESGGRISFAHDYLRIAISDRYLSGNGSMVAESQSDEAKAKQRALYEWLAQWFETEADSPARAAEEIPYQWRAACDWPRLKKALTSKSIFTAIKDTRSDEELLSYWLDLEREAAADLEGDYEAAWTDWGMPEADEETGTLASALSRFLVYAGRYQEFTLQLAQTALATAEHIHGSDHSKTASALRNLAGLCETRSDYSAAEALFRRALTISETALGSESPETGKCLDGLAGVLTSTGNYDLATKLYIAALNISIATHGERSVESGLALNNLGYVYLHAENYTAAEDSIRRSLQIAEEKLGSMHPHTAGRLDNLAQVMYIKGDSDHAEKMYRRSLSIREQVLGADHPETGVTLNNLGALLEFKKNYRDAERLFQRDVKITEKHLGREHPDTGIAYGNLGRVFWKMNDRPSAVFFFDKAFSVHRKSLGINHKHTWVSLKLFLNSLSETDDVAGLGRVLEELQNTDSSSFKFLMNIEWFREQVLNFCLKKNKTGNLADAEGFLVEVVNRPDADLFGLACFLLCRLRFEQEKYTQADQLLRRCLEIRQQKLSLEHQSAFEVLEHLAEVCRVTGREVEAQALLEGWKQA